VRELGFADRIEADAARAVTCADCVMLCTPVGAFAEIAVAIAPQLQPGAVLTDVGSTKQSVIRDVGPLVPPGVHFGHLRHFLGSQRSKPEAPAGRTPRQRAPTCSTAIPPATSGHGGKTQAQTQTRPCFAA
jgi:hypothetical protein